MSAYALRGLPIAALFAAGAVLCAQPPATSGASQSALPATAATSDSGPTATALLAPAITQIRQTLATLRPEKWKTPGAVAQETASNLGSIQRDLDNTLPGLLATADRASGSVAETLPAYRNIEALYDVVLRVTEVAKVGAPAPQSSALQQATATLEDARRSMGDRLQASAVAEGHAISTLQTQLRTAQSSPVQTASAPVCPAQPTAPKKRAVVKPKPKPAAAQPKPSTP